MPACILTIVRPELPSPFHSTGALTSLHRKCKIWEVKERLLHRPSWKSIEIFSIPNLYQWKRTKYSFCSQHIVLQYYVQLKIQDFSRKKHSKSPENDLWTRQCQSQTQQRNDLSAATGKPLQKNATCPIVCDFLSVTRKLSDSICHPDNTLLLKAYSTTLIKITIMSYHNTLLCWTPADMFYLFLPSLSRSRYLSVSVKAESSQMLPLTRQH